MKYCLSYKQDANYLQKADEIRIPANAVNTILDIHETAPNATIILMFPYLESEKIALLDWKGLENYNILLKNNFIIGASNREIWDECKKRGIKFYCSTFINSFYDLQAAKDYGCCYALISAPLTHSLKKVKQIGIPIRMVPNLADYSIIPKKDGVLGSWVRPEDVELYEPYVDVFEFETSEPRKERGLYRVYADKEGWPGSLNLLITNLNYQGTNRLLPRDLADRRINCGQRCLTGTHCRACYHLLNAADPQKVEKMREKLSNKIKPVEDI